MYWGSGVDLPDDGFRRAARRVHRSTHVELPAGREGASCRCSCRPNSSSSSSRSPTRRSSSTSRASRRASGRRCRSIYDREHTHNETRRAAARAAAPDAGEPHRRRASCRRLHRRRRAARPAAAAPAVPDRQAPAHQPDLPRPLPHRHARRRPAPEDHQPDLPVHRSARLDRALRARRRSRRLRPGAGAFPGAAARSSRPRPARWSRRSATR